jgi:hypothetical protein
MCGCRWGQDIQEVGRARVWEAYLQLVQALTSSELVELPPGTSYRHCSSAVLLRGSIRTSVRHCSVVSKTPTGAEKARFAFASDICCGC